MAARPPPLPVAPGAPSAEESAQPDATPAPPVRPSPKEEDADPKAAAMREVFEKGVKHFTAGRVEEALGAFREANALRPQPALVVTVATCLERLGRRGEAFGEYRRYLRTSGADLGPARRDAVEMALARLRPLVAFLDIAPPGPGVGVLVDGKHVELGPEPLPVDPGAHVVEPELLDGHRARERMIVGAGETRRVKLRFPPRRDRRTDEGGTAEHLAVVSPAEVTDDREQMVDMMLSTPLRDWVPKRGRWIGPVVAALAFGIGALAGATWGLQRALDSAGSPGPDRMAGDIDPDPPARRPAAAPNVAGGSTPAPAPPARDATVAKRPDPAPAPRLPAQGSTSSEPSRPAPAPSSMIEVEVTSEPPGAMVRAGGTAFGRTPIAVFLAGGRPTAVRLDLDGYETRVVRWSPRAGRRAIHAVLQPRAGPAAPPREQ